MDAELPLTDESLVEYREAFRLFDKNSDGTISLNELREVMNTIGYHPTPEELEDLMNEADENDNGGIDFTEFLTMMVNFSSLLKERDGETSVRQAFQVFDRDGDGFISKEELRYALTTLGEKLDDEEFEDMTRDLDVDHEGFVCYEDLVGELKDFCTDSTYYLP